MAAEQGFANLHRACKNGNHLKVIYILNGYDTATVKVWLRKQLNPDQTTPMHAAACSGITALFDDLCDKYGGDFMACPEDAYGNCVFRSAIKGGNVEIMRKIAQRDGTVVNKVNKKDKESPFMFCLSDKNYLWAALFMLHNFDIVLSNVNQNGDNILHLLGKLNDCDSNLLGKIVNKLEKNDHLSNMLVAKNNEQMNPMKLSLECSNNFAVSLMLLGLGAQLECERKYYVINCDLYKKACTYYFDNVKLIELKPCFEQALIPFNHEEREALLAVFTHALNLGTTDIVTGLLEILILNDNLITDSVADSMNLLHILAGRGDIIEYLRNIELQQEWEDAICSMIDGTCNCEIKDPNQGTIGHCTPLHIAAMKGEYQCIELYMKWEADIERVTTGLYVETAEQLVERFRPQTKYDRAKKLLSKGTEEHNNLTSLTVLQNQKEDNRDQLHEAVTNRKYLKVKSYLFKGCDPNSTDSDNKNTFVKAVEAGDCEMLELLCQFDAQIPERYGRNSENGRSLIHIAIVQGGKKMLKILTNLKPDFLDKRTLQHKYQVREKYIKIINAKTVLPECNAIELACLQGNIHVLRFLTEIAEDLNMDDVADQIRQILDMYKNDIRDDYVSFSLNARRFFAVNVDEGMHIENELSTLKCMLQNTGQSQKQMAENLQNVSNSIQEKFAQLFETTEQMPQTVRDAIIALQTSLGQQQEETMKAFICSLKQDSAGYLCSTDFFENYVQVKIFQKIGEAISSAGKWEKLFDHLFDSYTDNSKKFVKEFIQEHNSTDANRALDCLNWYRVTCSGTSKDVLSTIKEAVEQLDLPMLMPYLNAWAQRIIKLGKDSSCGLSEKILRKLAGMMKPIDWPSLGTELGFMKAETDTMERNNRKDSAGAAFDLLCTWNSREEGYEQVKAGRLLIALNKIGRRDISHELSRLLSPSGCSLL